MTNQQQIKLIENKIQQIQSTLTLWTQEIEKYTLILKNLIQQLNTIKKQLKETKKTK